MCGRIAGKAAYSSEETVKSSNGTTAAGQGVAQSGVQQSIESWSGAMPMSAPAIEPPSEGAAKAGPGLPARDSAINMIQKILVTLLGWAMSLDLSTSLHLQS